ncbi:hypothetical protein [Bradyrhizobium sp. DASA03007]|uniref:hypothetical protein n=1 Tax=unclassified Bradyrhizobium TaxID=2631580 RepID=UPI003F721A87
MNINGIPVIGWLISVLVAASMAVPFWLIWSVFEIGQTFFYWLPAPYLRPGFWQCVGLFMAVSIIKSVFIPKVVSVSQTNNAS